MEELQMSKVLNEDLVTLNLQAKTKKDAIEELVLLLKEKGKVNSVKNFMADVFYRETEGATGIGEGVAIPHGKSSAVIKTSIAIGITKDPIEWETLDDEPVSVIILFAVRDQDSDVLHIKLLQRVAILLSKDEFIEKLHNVKSKKALVQMFN